MESSVTPCDLDCSYTCKHSVPISIKTYFANWSTLGFFLPYLNMFYTSYINHNRCHFFYMKVYGYQVLGTRTTSNNEQLKKIKMLQRRWLFSQLDDNQRSTHIHSKPSQKYLFLLTGPHNASETVQNELFIAYRFTSWSWKIPGKETEKVTAACTNRP